MRNRIARIAIVIASLCISITSSTAIAQAVTYRPVPQECQAGRVVLWPLANAQSFSGTWEYVYWKADMYRWTAAGWTPYTGTPWMRAVSNGNYLVSPLVPAVSNWMTFSGNSYSIPSRSYPISLPSGSYAAVENVQWQNGSKTGYRSTFNSGTQVCSL